MRRGCIEIPYLLPDSTYCVQETGPLPGYIPDDTVHEVQVDGQGRMQGEALYVLKCENDYTKLRIAKLDAGNRRPPAWGQSSGWSGKTGGRQCGTDRAVDVWGKRETVRPSCAG